MNRIIVQWDPNLYSIGFGGWYAEVINSKSYIISNSMERNFPIDLNQFNQYQFEKIEQTFKEKFPNHVIEVWA